LTADAVEIDEGVVFLVDWSAANDDATVEPDDPDADIESPNGERRIELITLPIRARIFATATEGEEGSTSSAEAEDDRVDSSF
jgi:hypothetical protein